MYNQKREHFHFRAQCLYKDHPGTFMHYRPTLTSDDVHMTYKHKNGIYCFVFNYLVLLSICQNQNHVLIQQKMVVLERVLHYMTKIILIAKAAYGTSCVPI